MTRWVPGTDPLTPLPMSAAEVQDLVDRAQSNTSPNVVACGLETRERWDCYRAANDASAGAVKTMPGRPGRRPTCIARVGARYAMLVRCSLVEAARVLRWMLPWARTTCESIRYHWERLYPGVPALARKRTRAIGDGGSTC
jgi:hypothetical protein